MDIEVTVSNASLDDVVGVVFGEFGENPEPVLLGDVVQKALLDRLTADPRWGDLAQRFADAATWWMDHAAPDYVQELVRAEVTRQLESKDQGAVTRGQPSTRAEAYVATEVTTQLRARFGPLVERALANLAHDLQVLSGEAVDAFMKGSGKTGPTR